MRQEEKQNKQITFIDLFAGLGGFNVALSKLGCKCLFASELREDLQGLYKINFPDTKRIEGDITKVDLASIPQHDILCAGFPCQPFSQAGKRQGFDDEAGRGNMFDFICEIIKLKGDKKPSFLLLENVANLIGHDNKKTWGTIKQKLDGLGYKVYYEILSPHQYGYPQHRKRIYIVGIDKRIAESPMFTEFEMPKGQTDRKCDITTIIDENDTNIQPLNIKTIHQLKIWQEFLNHLKEQNKDIPSFPIWAMEFGADYPFEDKATYRFQARTLVKYKGNLGTQIVGPSHEECLKQIPIYSRTNKAKNFPNWKIRYIQQNREFYANNEEWLLEWLEDIREWNNSHQKFEWNCGDNGNYLIKDKIVQFRASGIRVKMPTYSPALNLVGTQVPILPWIKLPESCIPKYTGAILEQNGLTEEDIRYGRYLSTREAAKLQGMERLSFGNLTNTRIYEALGNAVNTQVVEMIAKIIIEKYGYGKGLI